MTDEALFTGFFASLGATVVALGAALLLAHKHHVRGHIGAVVAFVAGLLVTLVFAEQLGVRYDFQPLAAKVHLTLAFATAGFLLAPLVSGFLHWRGKASRVTHVWIARVFLVLTVATVGTGFWMLAGRVPAAPPQPGAPG